MENKKPKNISAKVIIINPPAAILRERHDVLNHPHLGLGYLSSYLRHNGFTCQPIDAKFERMDMDKLAESLKEYKPALVGITAMTHEVGQAAKVAKMAKELFPGVKTALGGAHASALPRETLAQFPEFDMVIAGEGEITFLELTEAILNKKEISQIAGIAFRSQDGVINFNACRHLIEDLDSIPFPAWDLFPSSQTHSIIASRGCIGRCKFCRRMSGDTVRRRSWQNIFEEIKLDVNKYDANQILIEDESFGVYKEQTYALLNALIESGINKKIKWTAQTRVDLVDRNFLEKMKEAGCTQLSFGVESGSEKILQKTGKSITLKKAQESIFLAKKVGLKTGSFFIIGHPYETSRTAWDTINFAAKLNTTDVAFGIMVPYPGTEIYKMALRGEGEYKVISSDWSDFNKTIGSSLELKNLSRKQLEKLQLMAYFIFYIKNWRFLDFFKLFLNERKVVFAVIKKILFEKSKR
jgi:anaerobic magnesium-protoporphyrin IX monomethyl ester cyclase